MKTLKNLLLSFIICAVAVPVLPKLVAAQTGMKIGFVRDERIKTEYGAWAKAEEQWTTEREAWETEAVAKQDELTELEDEYEKQKLILSEDKKRQKEAAINAKRDALDAYTKQIYGPNGTAERKHAELLGPLLEGISKAIEAVATAGNYDVIFTMQSGLGYIKDDYDVTDQVIKYLEENTK